MLTPKIELARSRIIAGISALIRDIESFSEEVTKISNQHLCPDGKVLIIQALVSSHFNLPLSIMYSPVRSDEWAHARWVAMWICREITQYSDKKTGSLFGGRNEAGVCYGRSEVKTRMKDNPIYAQEVTDLLRIARERIARAAKTDSVIEELAQTRFIA